MTVLGIEALRAKKTTGTQHQCVTKPFRFWPAQLSLYHNHLQILAHLGVRGQGNGKVLSEMQVTLLSWMRENGLWRRLRPMIIAACVLGSALRYSSLRMLASRVPEVMRESLSELWVAGGGGAERSRAGQSRSSKTLRDRRLRPPRVRLGSKTYNLSQTPTVDSRRCRHKKLKSPPRIDTALLATIPPLAHKRRSGQKLASPSFQSWPQIANRLLCHIPVEPCRAFDSESNCAGPRSSQISPRPSSP